LLKAKANCNDRISCLVDTKSSSAVSGDFASSWPVEHFPNGFRRARHGSRRASYFALI